MKTPNIIEDQLANGEAEISDAAAYALKMVDEDRHAHNDVIAVFRRWVWAAIDQRRRDPELRKWSSLIYLLSKEAHGKTIFTGPYDVLAALIDQSSIVAESHDVNETLNRKHVLEVLRILSESDGPMAKSTLMGRLRVRGPHMSNIARRMVNVDLVKVERRGKQTFYHLTKTGEKHLRRRIAKVGRPSRRKAVPQRVVNLSAGSDIFSGLTTVRGGDALGKSAANHGGTRGRGEW